MSAATPTRSQHDDDFLAALIELFGASRDGFCVLDAELRVCDSNDILARTLGLDTREAYIGRSFFEIARHMLNASAAAVASSSSEAPASGRPVSSATIVWKSSSASRRPWLISAW